MSKHGSTCLIFLLSAGLTVGCSDRSATAPASDGLEVSEIRAAMLPGGVAPDVSGVWSWSSTERLMFPPFVAIALGLAPEGENTHARCESEGTMELTQTGSTFEGTAEREFNACFTRGGQGPFQQPQSELIVEDGRITGSDLHFSFASATVRPCPHNAVVTEISSGVAQTVSGTGHCYLPNHPLSESPNAVPPPAGTTKTLTWEATR